MRPSWWDANDGLIDVVVDPGQAFGTGGHPTTRLCLALLLVLEEAGEASGPLADWGTGSGVQAIAAGKLGWGPITACDREPASLEAAAANAEANGIELEIERVDVRESPPPVAPTVDRQPDRRSCWSNAPGICARTRSCRARSSAPGCSRSRFDEVTDAFEPLGLLEAERRTEGDWAALLLRG